MMQARYSEFLSPPNPTEIIAVIMGSARWVLWVYGPQEIKKLEGESMLSTAQGGKA